MLRITRNKYIKFFHFAKPGIKTPNIQRREDYLLNLERGFILSITLIVLFFHTFPRFYHNKQYNTSNELLTIQVIDIPNLKPEVTPPLPVLKAKETIKLIKVKEISDDKNLRDEIKDLKLKLKIEEEDDELLLASSQLGDVAQLNFSGKNYKPDDFKALEFTYTMSKPSMGNDNSLSLDLPNAEVAKKYKETTIILETKSLPSENDTNSEPLIGNQTGSDLDQLIAVNKNQFLLKESESTIGTIEFKIWNRINSALDRLNKDRYGELPNNVKRISNGLTITFTYDDGGCHDIYWSKGGKVIIRVSGPPLKNQLDELEKAYDAILRLIYYKNSNSTS